MRVWPVELVGHGDSAGLERKMDAKKRDNWLLLFLNYNVIMMSIQDGGRI